jgi:hypothetical protein
MSIKEKKDYIEYHINYLNKKYDLNLWWHRKTNKIYYKMLNYCEKSIYLQGWLDGIMDFIDGIYTWIKIFEKENW